MKKKGLDDLVAMLLDIEETKRQARALGIFTNDRELLECPSCGLWEDVTVEGVLIVYHKEDPSQEDSGLRFREVDERHFVCPVCGATITVEDEDDQF